MIQQPSLDRFSQPGPFEKRYGVKVILLLPECDVCGQEAHPKFLQQWNGKEVCKYCRREMESEFERECGQYSEELTSRCGDQSPDTITK